jgi:hypothetical protein
MGEMKDGGTVAIILVLAVVLLLPIGYVLSSGPALWLWDHHYLAGNTWSTIYRPLYNDFGPLEPPLWWYWGLWMGEPAEIPT